ncbi:MAG: hypothetical protein BWK80_05505 [Desulfobacteraceae bacterium IS3]|nr:MAG: hypothetical protein BWK80_05505 [Desulfobacteraceae bacterium IS3]
MSLLHPTDRRLHKGDAMIIRQTRCIAIMLMLFFSVMACSTISPFNQRAYEQATSLKAEALMLMDKATNPYSEYQSEVESLRLNLEKAYQYAKGLPKNEITTRQFEILKDPGRNSLGGFLKKWEEESALSAGFVEGAAGLISDGFDTIIELESGKRKPEEISNR